MRDARLIEGMLGRIGLCEGVSVETLRELAMQTTLLRVARGEAILRRGERPRGLYAVAHGRVKTRLPHPDGGELVLGLLGPGSMFGKSAVVLDRPAKLDAIAVEDSLVVVVGSRALGTQMARDPRLARNVTNALAEDRHMLITQLRSSMLPALQRLAAYLDSIALPAAPAGPWAARLPVSKTLVAARLGIKKETLSRLLRRLAARGLITVARREVRILDRAALAALSSDPARGA